MSVYERKVWRQLIARSHEPRDWFSRDDVLTQYKQEGFKMWVYAEITPKEWTVGFFRPDGEWCAESIWNTAKEAAERVRWLNGGN